MKHQIKPSVSEKNISRAVEEALSVKVLACQVIKNGAINHVYKIKIPGKYVIARVFNFGNWPENGKLQWIEKKLTAHKIPHAKLLYFTRDKKYFHHGFMICEFIPGGGRGEALKRKHKTIKELYFEKGRILSLVHKIKVKKFGPLRAGAGKTHDFIGYKLKRAGKFLSRLASDGLLDQKIIKRFESKTRSILSPFAKTFRPVLVHGDATRKNTIWQKGNGLVLIDWDNAWSGIWLWDFIELSWWWRHLKLWREEKKRTEARKAFFAGYGKISCTREEIATLEHGLHLIKSAERLHFFYYDKKSKNDFARVKAMFIGDLNEMTPGPKRVILVDSKNREIGSEEKIMAHKKGLLHRAFSALIFNSKGELMLQKRAKNKYHSPGLWSNTCCSHPRPGEETVKSAARRLKEEMGFSCPLEECFTFAYRKDLGKGLLENEFDHVLAGKYNRSPRLNREEAEDWRWISLDELKKEIKKNPEQFTVWLKIIIKKLEEKKHRKKLLNEAKIKIC